MRRFGSALLIALAASTASTASTAWAKDEKPDPLREAQKLVASDRKVDAMRIYAAELAIAQQKVDIQWQQRVVRAILENIEPHMLKDRAVRVELIQALMEPLDPKQAYAFVYAGGLAYTLLHEMTVRDDRAGIDKVEAICVLQTKRKSAGPYERAMLAYAQGLKAAQAGSLVEALRGLDACFDIVRENGWAYSALHVGTELATRLVAKGDGGRAALALARVAQMLGPRADASLSADWIALVGSRLKGASDVALKPFNEFLETEPLKADKRQAAAGSDSKASGSLLKKLWKKIPKSQPFVTTSREESNFEITLPFDKKTSPIHALQPGVTYFFKGGLTLSFWDNRVRLYVADLEGWRGIPSPTYRPHPLITFTPLPNGSSWGVNRKGQLLVKHARK